MEQANTAFPSCMSTLPVMLRCWIGSLSTFLWHAASGILRSSEFSSLQWDERSEPGCMADILRVHDWSYVRSIQHMCASIPDIPSVVGNLDQDTVISNGTFRAAQVAVGGICRAVDKVVSGQVGTL